MEMDSPLLPPSCTCTYTQHLHVPWPLQNIFPMQPALQNGGGCCVAPPIDNSFPHSWQLLLLYSPLLRTDTELLRTSLYMT